MQGSYKTLLE